MYIRPYQNDIDEKNCYDNMFNMLSKSGLGKLFYIFKIDHSNKNIPIGTFIDESDQDHIINSNDFKYEVAEQSMAVHVYIKSIDNEVLEKNVRGSIINKCLCDIGLLGLSNASKYDELLNIDVYNSDDLKNVLDLLLCKIHMINTDADDQQTFIYIGPNVLDKYPIFNFNWFKTDYDDIFNIGTYSNHLVYSSNLTEGDNSNMIIVGIKPKKNQQGLRFIYDITVPSYRLISTTIDQTIYSKLTIYYGLESFSMNPERYYIGIIMQ